jgi:flagellar biosynthesis protein FlhF
MHIKRFEGSSMKAVLAEIREELGEDALILSSRTVRKGRGAFGLMARSRVEVQAAIERQGGGARTGLPAPPEAESAAEESAGSAGEASLAESVRQLQREVARLRGRSDFEEEMRSELRGLRAAMHSALVRTGSAKLDPLVEAMTREGLEWMHAESVAKSWHETEQGAAPLSIEDVLTQRIERRIVAPRTDAGDRLRILVGAPGVGKTTSLAKLAVRNEEGERDVALASLDHFRVGATAQLRDYAALLGAPFCEVGDVADLASVVERFRGSSVLVDTAGRSAMDGPVLGSLTSLRQAFGKRLCVDLVLDATAKRRVHRAQIERFARLAPDRILVTKTDECDSLADIANLALDEDCAPICWLGTGQRVPEDLEMADARMLAQSVLGRAA